MQLGISMLVAMLVVRFDSVNCKSTFYGVILVCAIVTLLVSVVANICFRCREGFGKTLFFVMLGGCVLMSCIALAVAFAGFGQANICASNKVTYKFMVIEIIAILVTGALVLFGSFFWMQRYSNSPGNVVWAFMFFGFAWNPAYNTEMTILGVLTALLSLITLLINILAAATGITSGIKRVIVLSWTVSMIIMLVN